MLPIFIDIVVMEQTLQLTRPWRQCVLNSLASDINEKTGDLKDEKVNRSYDRRGSIGSFCRVQHVDEHEYECSERQHEQFGDSC
jgi:hypothetical protein